MRLNTTWLIFLCTLTLMATGVVMVYSASAAIAAKQVKKGEELARKKERAKIQSADSKSVGEKPAPEQDGFDDRDAADLSLHNALYLKRQALWAILSIILLLTAYHIDYEQYKKYALPLLAVSFVLLVLVYVPGIGTSHKNSRRWINLGFFELQASELARLALIIFMARQLCERYSDLKSFLRGFLPAMLILAMFLVTIVKEPDLGAAVMIGITVLAMMYVAGMRLVHLSTLFFVALAGAVVAVIAQPYRVMRMLTYWDPSKDPQKSGWQLNQSLITVGTGGIWGLGLGQGPQKYSFLSEPHTDFIYAVICEELGMVGAIAVFALYAFFVIQGIRVAARAPDLYGSLLATGVTTMIGAQAFVNMAVVTGLVPTKGLTLPLISYGGSSMLVNAIAVGILMNVSRFTEVAAMPSRRAVPAYT